MGRRWSPPKPTQGAMYRLPRTAGPPRAQRSQYTSPRLPSVPPKCTNHWFLSCTCALVLKPRSVGKPHVQLKNRSEEHTSELQSLTNLVCRILLEKKKNHVS